MKNAVLKHSGQDMLEMFWNSNRIIFKGIDVSWVYIRRFKAILKFLTGRGAEFVTMSEVGVDIEGTGV